MKRLSAFLTAIMLTLAICPCAGANVADEAMTEVVQAEEIMTESPTAEANPEDAVADIASTEQTPTEVTSAEATPTEATPAVTTPAVDIKAFQVPAVTNYTTAAYAYASLTGYVTTIPKGTWVEYMNPDSSHSMQRARIRLGTGEVCWVPMSAIYISRYDYTIEDTLTNSEREAFVNGAGYASKTPYLIWVNKERQRLTVFLGSAGSWKALSTFPVASGKNTTPTPTKVCEVTYKTAWYTPGYVCKPVLYLYDGYAIHDQPASYSGYVLDTTIGHPASAGCVRMLKKDIEWVNYYVPVGTTVVLH